MRARQISVFLLAASILALGGCRDNDRPLSYEKGVYGGKPDKELSPEQVETLRQRGLRTYR